MMRESPGSIRYQLGNALIHMRQATADGDIWRKADLWQDLISTCAPHLNQDEEDELRKLPGVPRKDRDGTARDHLNDAIERKKSNLLRIMAGKGLYAYLQSETGDATSLALTDEDEETDGATP